jgi:type VII secretion protein EccE
MTAPTTADGPLTTLTGPARSGRIGVVQIVATQLAVMVVAGAFVMSRPVAAVTALLAIPLLLPVVARHRGRWWYEVMLARITMRARRRKGARAAVQAHGRADPELARLYPHLVVQTVTVRDRSVGVGADERGWFAAIALTANDGLSAEDTGVLRFGSIIRQAVALSAVQVVTRYSPPIRVTDPRGACALSYQELCRVLGVPSRRESWIAIRVDLGDAADRDIDEDGVHRSLSSAVVRISEMLSSERVAHRVLDAAGLRQALADAYGPDPIDVEGRRGGALGESWTRWRTTTAVHVSYAVTGAEAPADLARLADVPGAVAVCVGFVAGRMRTPHDPDDQIGGRLLIRVVAAPAAMRQCQRHLRGRARRLGLTLTRLDGEQALAVYATTPTAARHGWG